MKETNGILWEIDENKILRIAKAEGGNGKIPVTASSDSKIEYSEEGYETTVFTYDGTYNKPWTYEEQSGVIEVVIEEGITEITYGTFSNFSNLKKVTIPSSVGFIGGCAFRGCENLEEINLPEGIGSIKEETFLSCHKLSNIVIPQSVKSIDKSAFEHCYGIENIELPEGLVYIGENAFSFCSGLKTITIPDSVNNIGRDAFKPCESLRKAYLPADKIDTFKIAFDTKTGSYKNPDGSIYVYGTTLCCKSIFSKLFGNKKRK